MPKIKKILLVSCSAGSGHVRAAEALRLSAQKWYPEVEIKHTDLASGFNRPTRFLAVSSYNLFLSRSKRLYKKIFQYTDNELFNRSLDLLGFLHRFNAKKFIKTIEQYQPDCIVSTYFSTPYVVPAGLEVPLYTVITDYYLHNIWLGPKVKKFFTSTPEMARQVSQKGLNSLYTGIPIDPSFYQSLDLPTIRKNQQIENDWPVVLFMPASKGGVDLAAAIDQLTKQEKLVNVIAITGHHNRRLLKELSSIKKANVKILKHSKQIHELMGLADIIVTKAGGLTLTECLYLQKPTIIINPVSGQEEHNVNYFSQKELFRLAVNNEELTGKINELLSDEPAPRNLPFEINANQKILDDIIKTPS